VPRKVRIFLDAVIAARSKCDEAAYRRHVARDFRIIGSLQEQDADGFWLILRTLCNAFPGIVGTVTSIRRIAPSTYVAAVTESDTEGNFAPFNIISVYTLRTPGMGRRKNLRIVTEVITARVSDYPLPIPAAPPVP